MLASRHMIPDEVHTIIQSPDHHDCNDTTLKRYILELNFQYPDIIWAQAKLESSNYTSKIFQKENNLFGMKKSWYRITTSKLSTETAYANYVDWKESVLDRAFYDCKYMGNGLTRDEYLNKLQSNGYAQDSMYIKKLNEISKQFNKILDN